MRMWMRIQLWILTFFSYLPVFLSSLALASEPPKSRSICTDTVGALYTHASFASPQTPPHIHEPLPGLWDSIPVEETKVGDYTLDGESAYRFVGHTRIPVAKVKIELNSRRDQLSLMSARVPHSVRWIKLAGIRGFRGEEIPLSLLLVLRQMKLSGVKYGGLKSASVPQVTNLRTAFQLAGSPAVKQWIQSHPGQKIPDLVLHEQIQNTDTYRQMETFLVQSGHQIVGYSVKDAETIAVDDAIRQAGAFSPDPGRAEEVRVLNKLSKHDMVPFNFSIEFQLRPFTK